MKKKKTQHWKEKTFQECKTALTSQYQTVIFVFLSERSQVSKVTLCVKILKWRSLTDWLSKGRYGAVRAAKKQNSKQSFSSPADTSAVICNHPTAARDQKSRKRKSEKCKIWTGKSLACSPPKLWYASKAVWGQDHNSFRWERWIYEILQIYQYELSIRSDAEWKLYKKVPNTILNNLFGHGHVHDLIIVMVLVKVKVMVIIMGMVIIMDILDYVKGHGQESLSVFKIHSKQYPYRYHTGWLFYRFRPKSSNDLHNLII